MNEQQQICYLCGVEPANTRDHVFPANLFPKPLPTNLHTLPACRKCNESLSKDEELFRIVVASREAYEDETGNRTWTERVRPDLQGGRSGLKKFVQSLTKVAPVLSKTDVFLGMAFVLEVDREPVNNVLTKIAKGLHFLDTGQILPQDSQILCDYAGDQPERFISPPLDEAMRGAKRFDLGDGCGHILEKYHEG